MAESKDQSLLSDRQLVETTTEQNSEGEEALEKNDLMSSTENNQEFKIDYKEALKKLSPADIKKKGLERFNKFHKRLEYVIEKMPNSEEVQKRFEFTFSNICDSQRMSSIQTEMSSYITDTFEKTQLKMVTTNEVLKKDLLTHYMYIKRYYTSIEKYTEKVITSFVTVYFSVRMQTILAYIASIINTTFAVKLKKTGTAEVDAFQKSLTFYMFKKETLESDLNTMNQLVLAFRSETLKKKYYDVNFNLGGIKAAEAELALRKQTDVEVIKGTCSAILSIISVYLNKNQAVSKSMTEIFTQVPHTYGYFKEFLGLYSKYIMEGYNDVGELMDSDRKAGTEPFTMVIQDCTDFKDAKTVYKDIFSYVSLNKIGVDLRGDKTKFVAKEFFFKGFFTYMKKIVPAESEHLVDYDLFILHVSSVETLELEEFFTRFGLLDLSFHYQFMNDFSIVLFYDFKDIQPLSLKRYAIYSKATLAVKDKATPAQLQGMAQAQDMLVILKHIYSMYLYLRINPTHELSKFDKVKMNQITATQVYAHMFTILTTPAEVDKLVARGFISPDQFSAYYLHLVNYVCTKLGKTCVITEEPMLTIIKKYRVVMRTIIKVTIVEIIITIYKKYVDGLKLEKLKEKLTKIKFISIEEKCRGLAALPECKGVKDVYLQFITFVMEVFKEPNNGLIDQVMDYTFNYIQLDLGEETQEIIYLYFFHFFNNCRLKSKECPMNLPEFEKLTFWSTFLKRVKMYFYNEITNEFLKSHLLEFLNVFVSTDQRYKPAKNANEKSHFIIKLTESQFSFIEELVYFFIYQESLKDTALKANPQKFAIFKKKTFDTLSKLATILGVTPDKIYKDWDTFEKKMIIDESKVIHSTVAVITPRDWKVRTQNGIFEAIMTYSRLTIFLKGAAFFKTFYVNEKSLWGPQNMYAFQNPYTVLFNYFVMLHELADKNKFYLLHVNGYLYQQIKGCLKHTTDYNFQTNEVCQYSHRKYAEMYFFAQFNYMLVSGNPTIPIHQNYDDKIPPTHLRIFISSIIDHSTYLGEIEKACSSNEKTIFCTILDLTVMVKKHVISTDAEQLTTAQFQTKLFSMIPDTLTDQEVTFYRFSLLGASEVVSYLSLRSQTTDRFISFADISKEVKYNSKEASIQDNLKRLKTLQDKGIFTIRKTDKTDMDLLTSYLFRSFFKAKKTRGETKGAYAINALLKQTIEKVKELFTYNSVVYLDSFKIFLVYSPFNGYDKLTSLLIDQDIFLQIPLLNVHTFDEELNSLTGFLDCDDLKPNQLNYRNKKAVLQCNKEPGQAVGAQSNFYLSKIFRFIYRGNESISKNDNKQLISDNKDDILVNPNYDNVKDTVRFKIDRYIITRKSIEKKVYDKIITDIIALPKVVEKEVRVEIDTIATKRGSLQMIRNNEATNFKGSKIQEFRFVQKNEADEISKSVLRRSSISPAMASTFKDANLSERISSVRSSGNSSDNDINIQRRTQFEKTREISEQRSFSSQSLSLASSRRIKITPVFELKTATIKRISI